MNIQHIITHNAWVADDGSHGNGAIIVFDETSLNPSQWDTFDTLSDNDKYDYVLAVLNNEDLTDWENN